MTPTLDQNRTAPVRLLLCLALGCAGFICQGCKEEVEKAPLTGNRTVLLGADDSRINRAARLAQKSVDQFIVALAHPKPTQKKFGLKVSLHDVNSDETEDLWLDQITFENDLFHGSIVGEPKLSASYKARQRIAVSPEEIADWVYFEGDQMVGGYTQFLLERVEGIQSP